jgi:hypothetical protein
MTGDAPARLYEGWVTHARLKPVAHRFRYRVFSILVDLDRLRALDGASPIFSVGRFNVLSFEPADHGPRDGSDLRAHVDALLAQAGVACAGRTLLLCSPRVLGYVFNPISIYWRFDSEGRLRAVIYEVRNTFGQSHSYVAPVGSSEASGPLRQDADKAFYVSPFLDMDQHYSFRLAPPDARLRVRILERDADGPILAAAWSGEERPFTTRRLLAACLRCPFLTQKIMAAIHIEAARLWLKGLRPRPRRAAPTAPSLLPPSLARRTGLRE